MHKGIEHGFAGVFAGLAALAFGSTAAGSPQTPDVIVYDVGVNGSDINDIHYYGQFGGIAAYSIATQSCNSGTAELDWYDGGGDTRHPVIAQNMFRYKDGRFEQIGQSWLKHGFCAVNEIEAECAPCQSTPCDTLGIGCADTYWATLNDGAFGRSKQHVNAATGAHVDGTPGPSGNTTIRGRLQVAVSDIDPSQNPGAEYFIEGHYVTADDQQAGAGANNASWRRVDVNSVSNVDGGGPTSRESPAIYAWRNQDPSVAIQSVLNIEDGGAKTIFFIGYRVTQVSQTRWHYEYAIQNLNSDQSAGSFSLPVNPAVNIYNQEFHDVAYHSGDPYSGTDWTGVRTSGEIRWSTTDFTSDANANALRWGTLYNYRFDANCPPDMGPATIGLFKPSTNTSLTVADVLVPLGAPVTNDKKQEAGPPGGSFSIPLPITVPRNGSHTNPYGLVEELPAVVGQDWGAQLALEGIGQSVLFIGLGGPTEGVFTDMGEVLIRPPIASFIDAQALRLPIPDDPRLAGLTFSTQAAVLTPEGWKLTNALDVTIGLPASSR